MKMWRSIAVLIAPLLLAACWEGEPWYPATEGQAVIPAGDYRLVEPGAPPEGDEILLVAGNDDGSQSVTVETPWRIVSVPFGPAAERNYLVQMQKMGGKGHDLGASFLLMQVRDGRYLITILPCGGSVRAAVERAGGFVSSDPNSAPTCNFRDRALVESQLKAFLAMPDRPAPDMELVPVSR
ncbi:hypothetical protein [Sphingomonas colocasiae]|uniref:Lipoprotein n=1 Tax=Sphingomonas colocasiae TaxID=1848973 RepID=A0ABS7PVA5_9SPHN|nr:hypothetical protein [Sphingomonas colocasiae]MBY8825277.1 hypothetical protein [Sphingomonas colocasiae]